MTPPVRRPRLMAQSIEERASAALAAEDQRTHAVAALNAAEAVERNRAHRQCARPPITLALETAGSWTLSILGALIVSLALTWLVRHPQALDSLLRGVRLVTAVK